MPSAKTDEEIRIVIADDHPSYARGVGLLLKSVAEEIELVGTAGTADEALKLVENSVPDLVLMDIQMPGGGIEATRRISQNFPAVKVVMLTVSEEDEDVFAAMKAGASGFLPKQVEVEELVAAIRAVHHGQVVVSPQVANKLLKSAPDETSELTEVERSLLKLVAEGRDNSDIGREIGMSEATVKRLLKNVVQKLHLHNRVQAAVYAAKKGWV